VFGKAGTFYKRGCHEDEYVYRKEKADKKWKKLGNIKAKMVAASPDGVWMISEKGDFPYKLNEATQKFQK